jgi:hypothetical protein
MGLHAGILRRKNWFRRDSSCEHVSIRRDTETRIVRCYTDRGYDVDCCILEMGQHTCLERRQEQMGRDSSNDDDDEYVFWCVQET